MCPTQKKLVWLCSVGKRVRQNKSKIDFLSFFMIYYCFRLIGADQTIRNESQTVPAWGLACHRWIRCEVDQKLAHQPRAREAIQSTKCYIDKIANSQMKSFHALRSWDCRYLNSIMFNQATRRLLCVHVTARHISHTQLNSVGECTEKTLAKKYNFKNKKCVFFLSLSLRPSAAAVEKDMQYLNWKISNNIKHFNPIHYYFQLNPG